MYSLWSPRPSLRCLLAAILSSAGTYLSAADCNENGIEDSQDTATQSSADCNLNGVPDECESAFLQLGFRANNWRLAESPEAVVVADLNGDDVDDVIVGHRGTPPQWPSYVMVFFGSVDGDPSLAGPTVHAAGTNLTSITAADFDGDGDIDVASANSTELSIFANDGDGALSLDSSFTVDKFTRFVVSADITGNGIPDLISANNTTDLVETFRGSGTGTFSSLSTLFAGERPEEVAVDDLNGDGTNDLAVRNRDSGTIGIHLATANGNFAPGRFLDAGRRPVSIGLGDFDDDGARDLAIVSSFDGRIRAAIRRNHGDGTFEETRVLESSAALLQVGDMDRDGRDDLILSPTIGILTILTQQDGGQFVRTTLSRSNFGPMAPGDFDGDGWEDLALVSEPTEQLDILWSGVRRRLAFEPTQVAQVLARPHGGTGGDVNGDGLDDVLVGTGPAAHIAVFLNQADGSLSVPLRFPTGTTRVEDVAVADLDADGDLDMIGCDTAAHLLAVYQNPGEGDFLEPRVYRVGSQPRWATTADLDADGFPEIINSNTSDSTITVLSNNGDGTFRGRVELGVDSSPRGIATPDVDGDGDPDVVVSNRGPGTLSIFINDRGRLPPPVSLPIPGNADFVTAGDFNEDGRPDLAVTNSNEGTIVVALNDSEARFADQRITSIGQPAIHVISADFDNDGHLDLVTANGRADNLTTVSGTGTGAFEFPNHMGATHQIAIVVIAVDLAGDGAIDVVGGDHDGQRMRVFTNTLTKRGLDEDFLETVCTAADFERLALVPDEESNIDFTTKYTLPVREDPALLPLVFQNSRRYLLHQEFLASAFPERFPALTTVDYNNLIFRRATRQYFVGVISRLRTPNGIAYGFSVVTDTTEAELLTLEEIREIRERLRAAFLLEPLGYFPDSFRAREVAETFVNPGFPVYLEDGAPGITYQPYTRGVGYGRVRNLDEEGFQQANESGQISFQNILILKRAPRDIEGVIGGVITAEPQGELSHLSIRTARRKTPNAFVQDAAAQFAEFEGKLVRLEVTETEALVEEVTPEEAEEFWASNRPQLSEMPSLDTEFQELSSLVEIAAMDEVEAQERRFGGKATNLARLGRTLAGSDFDEYREFGFAIPVHHYLEFLRSNTRPSQLDANREVTYEEHLLELLGAEDFTSDSTVRFQALEDFRTHARENGIVDPTLVERIHQRVADIFPSTRTPVRFRSSSNVEDALEFNGAGLYESTGACVDDDLDHNTDGPSLCDPDKANERGIERALKKVWTSVYTFRAFEERNFYGIAEDQVGMGILVSRAFPNELANGVAFTGNLSNPADKRYVVTAQVGEESVVSPDPGVLPEKNVLEISDGAVVRIIRPQLGSTLVDPGIFVLSDAHLERLGAAMSFIDQNLPLDLGNTSKENVLLDMEFKLEPDDTLAIKQVRPFLLSDEKPPTPEFKLEIPHDLEVCGIFQVANDDRGPLEEYRLKSTVRLVGGTHTLITGTDSFTHALVQEVRVQENLVGPGQETADPLTPEGVFRFVRFNLGGGVSRYRFRYEQEFVISSGERLRLEFISGIQFEARGNEPISGPLRLDEDFFTMFVGQESLQTSVDDVPLIHYGDCRYEAESRFRLAAELPDGTSVELEERWRVPENLLDTGPARVVDAVVRFGDTERRVTDYWNLVYSAFRHNQGIRYWIVLQPPARFPDLPDEVGAIELVPPEMPQDPVTVAYLGTDFTVLRRLTATEYVREEIEPPLPGVFLRGDAQGDGSLDLTDTLTVLRHVFRGESLGCRKAADANDDSRVNIVDALEIIGQLFRANAPLPAPFPECGVDPTEDGLTCELPPLTCP